MYNNNLTSDLLIHPTIWSALTREPIYAAAVHTSQPVTWKSVDVNPCNTNLFHRKPYSDQDVATTTKKHHPQAQSKINQHKSAKNLSHKSPTSHLSPLLCLFFFLFFQQNPIAICNLHKSYLILIILLLFHLIYYIFFYCLIIFYKNYTFFKYAPKL